MGNHLSRKAKTNDFARARLAEEDKWDNLPRGRDIPGPAILNG
jgi:hypothetical protein